MQKPLITAILLLLAPLAGWAQVKLPPCVPLVYGHPVGMPGYARGAVGQHVFWMCTDAKGQNARWYGFSCATGSCSYDVFAASLRSITRASAKVGTAKAEYTRHIGFDCDVPQPTGSAARALCEERQQALQNHIAVIKLP